MRVVNVEQKIIEELDKSKILQEMPSLRFCNLLVLADHDGIITGAAGVGGIFKITALQIKKEYQKRGLGVILYKQLLDELKQRSYPFVMCYVDTTNTESLEIHDYFNFLTLFRVHLSLNKTLDIKILELKSQSKIIKLVLGMFNTKLGHILLAIILKIMVTVSPKILVHTNEGLPHVNVRYMIKNFEKIRKRKNKFKKIPLTK